MARCHALVARGHWCLANGFGHGRWFATAIARVGDGYVSSRGGAICAERKSPSASARLRDIASALAYWYGEVQVLWDLALHACPISLEERAAVRIASLTAASNCGSTRLRSTRECKNAGKPLGASSLDSSLEALFSSGLTAARRTQDTRPDPPPTLALAPSSTYLYRRP